MCNVSLFTHCYRNINETREPRFWTDTVNEELARAYKDSERVNIVCGSRGEPQVVIKHLFISKNDN